MEDKSRQDVAAFTLPLPSTFNMATFAFTQSVASCASLKSVRGKAPKARRGASVIRAANLMDTARSAGFTAFADAVTTRRVAPGGSLRASRLH